MMIVYVLHISTKYGDNYWVYSSEEGAKERLARWARLEWSSEGVPGEAADFNDGDAIAEYFNHVTDYESYNIDDVTVDDD